MADTDDKIGERPDPDKIAKRRRQLEHEAAKAFKDVKKTASDVLSAPVTGRRPDDPRRDALYAQRNRKQSEADRIAIAAIAAIDPRAAVTYEGIIDTEDFLHLDYLVKGIAAAASIGQIRTRDGQAIGTGFICAPGLIMTNNHVVRNSDIARFLDIAFEVPGADKVESTVPLAPDRFFFCSPPDALDVTIVAMDAGADKRMTDHLGWHPFKDVQGKIALGRPVSVIQYPQGRGKQIVLHNSILLQIADVGEQEIAGNIVPLDTPYLWYTSDTMRGSSGSPVFNRNYEVIALHHAGVPKRLSGGKYAAQDGGTLSSAEYDARPERAVFLANRGIRASRIVAALSECEEFATTDMVPRRNAILESWKMEDGQAVVRQRMRARVFGPDQDHGTPDALFESIRARGGPSSVDSVLFEEIARRLQDGSMTIGFRYKR